MRAPRRKGFFIVLEGIDGSGKSTQAARLAARLRERGFDVTTLSEPTGGIWGRRIREKAAVADSLTPEEELALFVKDRRENVDKYIRPALREGRVVVLDRYYFSTMAYQGAKGLDPEEIRSLNQSFAVIPDLVLVLDISARAGLSRIKSRGPREPLFEREDYLRKVRDIFLSLRDEFIRVIDAERPEEVIAAEIEALVLERLAVPK